MAKIEIDGFELGHDLDNKPQVRVVLSKRNLLALLHKVDVDWSQKTILNDYIYLDGELLDIGVVDFIIVAEPDAQHYSGRKAGPMIDKTEKFIAAPYCDEATDSGHSSASGLGTRQGGR